MHKIRKTKVCRYRMEQDEKFENQLNLALDLSEEERERSKDLDAGYEEGV